MFVVKSSQEKKDTDKLKEIYDNPTQYNNLVRKEAIKILGEIGGKRSFPTLVQASKDKDNRIRAEAAFAIGKNTEGREHHLIELLNDENVDVKIAAIISIRNIDGVTKAIDSLVKLLADPDERVRIELIKTLGILGDKKSAKDIAQFLNDKSEMIRLDTIKTLGKLEYAEVVDSLIELLKDKNSFIRREAVGALGRIGDKKAVEPLLNLLEDENRNVVLRTIKSLGELGGERVIDPLIKLLDSDDEFIKWEVMWALGRSKTPKAEDLIINALEEKDERIIIGAAKILASGEVKRAVDKMIEVIAKKNYQFSSDTLLIDMSLSILTLLFQILIKDKIELKEIHIEFLKNLGEKGKPGIFSTAISKMEEESKKEVIILLGKKLIINHSELSRLKNSITIEDNSINKFLNNFLDELRSEETIRKSEIDLEKYPNDANRWYTQGNNYIEIKDWQNAVECFQRATELDPQMSDAWNGLGWSLGQIGEYQKTLDYCKRAVELDPNAAYSWHSIGWAYNK
ncbi:MAG: HEAT repeat domain-containing protein, partial [Promethearchaeota archaeon]